MLKIVRRYSEDSCIMFLILGLIKRMASHSMMARHGKTCVDCTKRDLVKNLFMEEFQTQ